MNSFKADVVIIGAGASGMMAAYFASLNGKTVYLLDHNKQVGRKIIVSGGGKCNFTNLYGCDSKDYYCENKHFVKSALSRYTQWDFINLIEENEVPYEERLHGQLFCKRSAKDINTILLKKITRPNVKILLSHKDLKVTDLDNNRFKVFNDQLSIETDKLIIATGGLVLPQIGASDFGHKLAKTYGHKIIPMSPALVPFKLQGFSSLSGNAFIAGITCNGHYVAENVLFTHKGLSGPGVLKTSLFWNPGDSITVNWLVDKDIETLLNDSYPKTQLKTVLKRYLPNNFIELFFERIGIDSSLYASKLNNTQTELIKRNLHSMVLTPDGSEGFRKAETTRGGICTELVSSKTMQSKLRENLYFIGEVLDVAGQLGGHNFQWCWSSAFAAGESVS